MTTYRITPTRAAILAQLSHTELHGLEIAHATGINRNSIYVLLHRLQSVGYVTSKTRPLIDGGRARYYRITAAGRIAFNNYTAS